MRRSWCWIAIAATGCGRFDFASYHDASLPTISTNDGAVEDACASPPELAVGLVAWWRFDEPSGAVANDSVMANNGTLLGGVVRAPGHLGGAISLDGTTGRVNVAGAVPYATHGAAFSFSAWGNLMAWTDDSPDMMEVASDDASSPFHVLWSNNPNYYGLSTGDGDGSWIPTRTNVEPSLDTWHHVVLVYDGSDPTAITSFTFYLDGVAQPLEQAVGYSAQSNANRIGAAEAAGNYWNGLLDDVRLYARALSSSDVAALFSLACE